MCIVAIAWQAHPRWQLIVIGNRDEMHARPAQPLARWEQHDHLLAGRDIQAGGTWLGVSERGRFAVVTNVSGKGVPDPQKASRGDLLKDFLSYEGKYANIDSATFSEFNPFNLMTVEGNQARVHSNRPDGISKLLTSGIHGLSNGSLGAPWPKSNDLNRVLEDWTKSNADNPLDLLEQLRSDASYAPQDGNTPEPQHSPIFIRDPVYGTRCSTVLAIDKNGQGLIAEHRFTPAGQPAGETSLSFSWPVP